MFFRELNQKQLRILRKVSNYTAKLWRWESAISPRDPVVKNADRTQRYADKAQIWNKNAHEAQFMDGFVSYNSSRDNFIIDPDGNQILDLSMQGGNLAFGYNPDPLIFTRAKRGFDKYLAQTPNLAEYPPHDFSDFVRSSVLPAAPKGCTEVQFTEGTGGLANEAAIKAALLKFKDDRSGLKEIDWDNYDSNDFSNNSKLLQNDVSVLSFEHSSHGTTLGGLSTNSNTLVNSIAPTYNWAIAPTPNTTYPYQKNKKGNLLEEKRCLEEVKSIIEVRKNSAPVGAMIIEPITFLGHHMPTPTYFRKLRAIAKDYGIPFIVDETRTGIGKTGKFWAHEHWHLDDTPDFVTFGTSAVASGYFAHPDFRPLESHKLSTISNGSMDKLIAFKSIIQYIKKKRLIELADDTGACIKSELDALNRKRRLFTNLRGNGTFLGLDVDDYEAAVHLQTYLIRNGILVAIVGPHTIGIRPSLLLTPTHASHLRDALHEYNPKFHFESIFG